MSNESPGAQVDDRDTVMESINAAIALVHGGDGEGARESFTALWTTLGPNGDPFHRCTLAHFMADVQADPREELIWDLRALEAANSLTDERVKAHHASLSLQGFYPSLHLNVAESYRKTARLDLAREHVVAALKLADGLPEDGYGKMIRAGIDRIASQLGLFVEIG